MLYGDRLFVDQLMQEVHVVENERGIEAIFGSTIGSISRGIQRYTSDYDVRFLYVDKDKNFISSSERHVEDRIRYRKFNDSKAYNCIAFWEISAFLNFLCEPYIDQGIQYKLIRNVMWSFLSPYQLDPYGISGKILPLLLKAINIDCETNHHYEILKNCCRKRNAIVPLAEYFEFMHAYLSLLWIKQEQAVPPLHIMTLMHLANSGMREHINHYLAINRRCNNSSVDSLTAEITDSIYRELNALTEGIRPRNFDIINELKNNESLIEYMLCVVQSELHNEQSIYHINNEIIRNCLTIKYEHHREVETKSYLSFDK